jgi:hypothetical protein
MDYIRYKYKQYMPNFIRELRPANNIYWDLTSCRLAPLGYGAV